MPAVQVCGDGVLSARPFFTAPRNSRIYSGSLLSRDSGRRNRDSVGGDKRLALMEPGHATAITPVACPQPTTCLECYLRRLGALRPCHRVQRPLALKRKDVPLPPLDTFCVFQSTQGASRAPGKHLECFHISREQGQLTCASWHYQTTSGSRRPAIRPAGLQASLAARCFRAHLKDLRAKRLITVLIGPREFDSVPAFLVQARSKIVTCTLCHKLTARILR